MKSGKRYWSDWTPVAGQQFEYGFDDIGNRNSTKSGGDSAGANLRVASYTNNSLNQITGRQVPAYLNVIGAATATATNVNVNNTLAYRKGEYYRVELSPNNTSAAVWQSVTNRAVQSGTTNSVTGNAFLPKNPEVFGYDADGNLTNDGRWAYVWDGENRLVRQFAPTTAPGGSVKALTYGYDWQGRRISKTVSNYSGGSWSRVLEEKYLYDGWNLLSSLNATNSAVVQAFLWGTDLSGSMQGAGGVGGLLAVKANGVSVTFAAYDGNGNVTALANAADGNTLATYEYGPFGEVIRASGAVARTNPFRFSTKFQDDETDLLYYGYRYYSQGTGRWLGRDPIGERGGKNLYGFVFNDPGLWTDVDGRAPTPGPGSGKPAGNSPDDVTDAQCSKFAWWNKTVGVTLTEGLFGSQGCKSYLTQWGEKMPKFLQDCVWRHEGVHADLCKKAGGFCYGLAMMGKRNSACGEHIAYAESIKCGKEAMSNIATMSEEDQLALRCFLATSRQSCKANKAECDKGGRLPGAPSCD